jgi:hypothetical protein
MEPIRERRQLVCRDVIPVCKCPVSEEMFAMKIPAADSEAMTMLLPSHDVSLNV